MRITAVVVSWNAAADLPGCLDALLAQDHPDLEVLVVDNASTDGSHTVLQPYERSGRVRVLWNATNRGFGGAVNDGLAASDGDAVLVCNPDTVARADHVRHLAVALEADPRRGAVQGKLLRTRASPTGAPVLDSTGHVPYRTRLFANRGEGEVDRGQFEAAGPVFGVSGALALYRRAMLDDVALPRRAGAGQEVFDEDLFAFWEDVDLDWRAARRGWTVRYEPGAVAEHERGGAGPRRTIRVEQLNFQNRLLTLIKNDSPSRFLRDLPGFLVTTALKAAELAVTVPAAFVRSFGGIGLVPRMLRKRRVIAERATVPTEQVIDRWFGAFDYGRWVRTWWRRIRGVPPGT